jgi:hypothetical protein
MPNLSKIDHLEPGATISCQRFSRRRAKYRLKSELGQPRVGVPGRREARTQDLQLELECDRSLFDDACRLLGECELFRGLGPDERKALFASVRIRNFAAGEIRGPPW